MQGAHLQSYHVLRVMLGPYIKSRVTRAIKMSSNAALITMETYVQQGETI